MNNSPQILLPWAFFCPKWSHFGCFRAVFKLFFGLFCIPVSLVWGILSHFGSGAGIADFSRKFSQKNCGKSFVSFLKNTENV